MARFPCRRLTNRQIFWTWIRRLYQTGHFTRYQTVLILVFTQHFRIFRYDEYCALRHYFEHFTLLQTSFARKRVTGRSNDFQFTDSNSTCHYLLFSWNLNYNGTITDQDSYEKDEHASWSSSTAKVCFYSCYRKLKSWCYRSLFSYKLRHSNPGTSLYSQWSERPKSGLCHNLTRALKFLLYQRWWDGTL